MYWRQGIYLNWSPEAYCLVESAVFDNNPDSFLKITAPSCRKGELFLRPICAWVWLQLGILVCCAFAFWNAKFSFVILSLADRGCNFPVLVCWRLHPFGTSCGSHWFSYGRMVSRFAGYRCVWWRGNTVEEMGSVQFWGWWRTPKNTTWWLT